MNITLWFVCTAAFSPCPQPHLTQPLNNWHLPPPPLPAIIKLVFVFVLTFFTSQQFRYRWQGFSFSIRFDIAEIPKVQVFLHGFYSVSKRNVTKSSILLLYILQTLFHEETLRSSKVRYPLYWQYFIPFQSN